MNHGPTKQVYADGAIYHNNPIQIADKERKLIWPALKNECPDITLSVGTTYNFNAKASTPKDYTARVGVFSHGKSLYKIASDHIASALDSEKTWLSYMNVLQPGSSNQSRYVRLNPQLDEDPPPLDGVDSMQYIQEKVRDKMSSDDRVQKIALQLIATSFYFEKSTATEIGQDGSIRFKGQNRSCRSLVVVLMYSSRLHLLPTIT